MKGVLPPLTDYRKIQTSDLQTYKLYALMPAATFAVRAMLHPLIVVKTRMQTASNAVILQPHASRTLSSTAAADGTAMAASARSIISSSSSSSSSSLRGVVATMARQEGFRGFYAGFGVIVTGLAVGPLYMSTMLFTQEHLQAALRDYNLQHAPAGGDPTTRSGGSSSSNPVSASSSSLSSWASWSIPFLSGAVGSCVAQLLGVPLDVVSQKQMYGQSWSYEGTPNNGQAQGTAAATAAKPRKGAIHIAKKVWKTGGWKGFYKGQRQ